MKYIKSYKLFESTPVLTQEQIDWLDECTKDSWSLNQDTGLVDIDGDFDCWEQELVDFKGVRFGVVTGGFQCSYNQLTSLVGAPQEVGGSFDFYSNQLTSLVGAPQKVGVDFSCSGNQLTSLEGAPQEVGGSFDCSENQLTSLVGAPQEVGGSFYCDDNQLTSLAGAPQEVGGSFYCNDNQLTSLVGAPQKVGGSFRCSNNPVSKETLKLIFSKMQSGIIYPVALASSKKDIPKKDWKLLDKTGLDPDLEKGASLLGRLGAFDA